MWKGPRSSSAVVQQRARQMRFALTPSEAAVWAQLSGRKLGVQFRRQVVVGGRFIADFCAPSARLIVEVDGGYHASRTAADARRDRALARLGFRVLRLPAALVLSQPEEAVARVLKALQP